MIKPGKKYRRGFLGKRVRFVFTGASSSSGGSQSILRHHCTSGSDTHQIDRSCPEATQYQNWLRNMRALK